MTDEMYFLQDLLKFFASLAFTVFVHSVGDVLVDQIFTLLNDSLLVWS